MRLTERNTIRERIPTEISDGWRYRQMNRKMKLRIYFENTQDKLPVSYSLQLLIREAIETTLDFEDFHNTCEVSVTFTDNEGIHELNKKFRGVDISQKVSVNSGGSMLLPEHPSHIQGT